MGRTKIPAFIDDIRQFPKIMTTGQVAAYLQLSNPTVVQHAELGIIPGRKIGTQWRFCREKIQEFMEANP